MKLITHSESYLAKKLLHDPKLAPSVNQIMMDLMGRTLAENLNLYTRWVLMVQLRGY